MSKLYLGFDAGTQSVKVSVYDENLKSITSQSLPTILRYPHAGWVEMDLDEFLDITVRCIKRCVDDIKALGYDPKDVRSVMGDGIICGIAGVNEEGDAITPYINYLDTRTDDDVRFINDMNLDIWVKIAPLSVTLFFKITSNAEILSVAVIIKLSPLSYTSRTFPSLIGLNSFMLSILFPM